MTTVVLEYLTERIKEQADWAAAYPELASEEELVSDIDTSVSRCHKRQARRLNKNANT